MTYFKYCRRLSYYKHGEYMEPPCSVHPIAGWCIFGIEVYSGTGQLSFLSPRGGKYIEIPRGVRYHHGVLSFGGTYIEVSFDADVATEHGIRAAVVLNHIAHLRRRSHRRARIWRSRPRLPQLVHVDRDGKRRRMTAPIKTPARNENIYGGSS